MWKKYAFACILYVSIYNAQKENDFYDWNYWYYTPEICNILQKVKQDVHQSTDTNKHFLNDGILSF